VVTGDRIEGVLDTLLSTGDPDVQAAAEELVRALTELYGAGLSRVVDLVERRAPAILPALLQDDLVAGLLELHGPRRAPAAPEADIVPISLGPKRSARREPTLDLGAPRSEDACEMCAAPIGGGHGHVVEIEQRSLKCTCRPCYLLFAVPGAAGGRFRAVPDRWLHFPGLQLTAGQWDALQVPVSVAFFFTSSTLDRVAAFYPSPAGATESLLPLDAWADLVADHPELGEAEPDVEAILVRSDPRSSETACYLVPIDACYELVGQLRMLWRGFDGGADARDALEAFFDRVRDRSRPHG
jgi:hypothetical protein